MSPANACPFCAAVGFVRSQHLVKGDVASTQQVCGYCWRRWPRSGDAPRRVARARPVSDGDAYRTALAPSTPCPSCGAEGLALMAAEPSLVVYNRCAACTHLWAVTIDRPGRLWHLTPLHPAPKSHAG